MFLVLPVWHRASRLPLLTSALIAANALCFAVLWPREKAGASLVTRERWRDQAVALCKIITDERSGLPADRRAYVRDQPGDPDFPDAALREFFRRLDADKGSLSSRARYEWDTVYPVFVSQFESLKDAPAASTPYERLGFRTGDKWSLALMTHQFLHAGVWHLVFNMLFLWVLGCVLEERYGAGMVVVYLFGGAAGALAQAAFSPFEGSAVMVGASGAVSALLGLALFRFPGARVTIFYLLAVTLMPRTGTFESPLWFFAPLWLLNQVLMALLTHDTSFAGVGNAAHLGGFAFGALAAFLLPPRREAPG